MLFIVSLVLILAVLLVLFTIQNSGQVEISFFVWNVEISLALVLLLCVITGVVLGTLFSIPGIWKRKGKIKELKLKVKKLEKDLKEANTNIPVPPVQAPLAPGDGTDKLAPGKP